MEIQRRLHENIRFPEEGVGYDRSENLFSLCDVPNF